MPNTLESKEKALSLAEQALVNDSPQHAIEQAEEALRLDPECALAWLARAEAEDDEVKTALHAYRKAAEFARQELGESFFTEEEGHFWEVLESRPYMQARLGEALCLYECGQPEESVTVLTDMLRLNPADDQGVRYILLSMLLELENIQQAHALLDEYGGDTSPVWLYGQALTAFLLGGPVPAEPAKQRALKYWPAVADYLAKPLPEPLEEGDAVFPEISDDPDEEELCAYEMRKVWDVNPTAKAWLLR